ncbi:MAG: hypothetical protein Q8O55_11695 [Dehalococcoidales bacterium]|nr:hypothetical protein [Dehalococcoidales bacterium]
MTTKAGISQSLSSNTRRPVRKALLSFLLLALLLPPSIVVQAQGGIALSGTFSQQEFELPQGVEVSNPSIYVVVFNHTGEEMTVQMSWKAPFGVEVAFDQAAFPLPPGGEQKVLPTIKVTEDAVPGEYEVTVSARFAPREGGEGVQLATASAQKARLVVTGDAAWITVRVITPDGNPIKTGIKVFKVIQDRLNEITRSETGTLEVKVSPGTYRISAFLGSRQLAEESVEVRAGESKEITLVVKPIYFEFFDIEPNFAPDSKEITFARVVYTLNNLSEPLNNGEVMLQVNLDDKPLEQVSLITLSRLDIGRTDGSYSYVPAQGWVEGIYDLRLKLNIEGELYIESDEKGLPVAFPPPFPIIWLIAAAVAALVAAAIIFFLIKRRKEPAKPIKKPAKKPEEKEEREKEEAEEEAEELAPQPEVPPAEARNLRITGYDNIVKRGTPCNVRVGFDYQGPALTGTISVFIGTMETAGFTEQAHASKQAAAPETPSWKTFAISVSVDTAALSEATYSLYTRIHGAFPEITSPYLENVITIEEP